MNTATNTNTPLNTNVGNMSGSNSCRITPAAVFFAYSHYSHNVALLLKLSKRNIYLGNFVSTT